MSARTHAGRAARNAPAPSNWQSRIVGHAQVDPASLIAHPENWRRHPRSQRRALRATLDDVGWVQSILVSRRSGQMLDGYLRAEEALRRHEPTVPVTFVDLDEAEERLVLATFDTIGAFAQPDPDALRDLLSKLGEQDGDLAVLLEALAASAGVGRVTPADPDDAPERPDESSTYVRPAQLWRLGNHRLLCGSATDPAAVHRLLGAERPTLLVTDPPYGVRLDLERRHAHAEAGRPRGSGHRRAALAGDERADWSPAFELVPSLAVGYVWHPALHVRDVIAGLERIGFELVSEIVWSKSRWTVGHRWYHWQHESCLVVRRHGARSRFLGGRDQGTVWEAPSPKLGGRGADPKADNPSQKPAVLFERPIRNHLPPGGIAYDPFLGSGTAIVAAEISGRRCLAMELDPSFVQVAIERWQRLTGTRAEVVDDGAP